MTTYVTTGFNVATFEAIDFSIQTEALDPVVDYSVNWREPNGLFNSSFDADVFDILIGEVSVKASNPYLDTYFIRYDWDALKTTYMLSLLDQVTGQTYVVPLGGDVFDLTQAATIWPQVTSGTFSNPLPGTGFAIGEGIALSELPGVIRTENDLIIGTDGNDVINSGIGEDTVKGRPGDDTLDGQDGADLVDGGGGNDMLMGGNGDDLLLGSFGDDTLDGGIGADTLRGGQGSDVYYLDDVNDLPRESRNFTGTDRIVVGFDYTLNGHYEELELTGSDDLRGIGNTLDNLLIGNSGDNLLDGGAGVDTLRGGDGDDTYYLRDAGDVADEEGTSGRDTILTWISAQASDNIENVVLKSTTEAAVLQGNTLANSLTGNMADNALYGGQGNDTLVGQGGDDTLNGGNGRDLLVGGDGSDTYYITNQSYSWRMDDTVHENAAHSGTDHVISDGYVYLRGQHVENITILNSTNYVSVDANDLDNIIRHNDGDGRIKTFDGDDLIHGRGGHDTIWAGAGDDTLLGGNGNDFLDGGPGADIMSGGVGNDTYVVDDIDDRVIEGADSGGDTLQSAFDVGTLAQALENLTLIGTANVGNGNAKDNYIYGNDQNNLLQGQDGNDILNGGNGNDTLNGGVGDDRYNGSSGSDTYFMLDAGDSLQGEYRWYSGSDTVVTNQSFTASYYNDIENVRLVGNDDIDAARYNYSYTRGELRGNAGDNFLDGSLEAIDTMLGGMGDDVYKVENKRDVVVEGLNAGDDMVRSTVSFALGAHIERLKLEGQTINGFGNALDNIIVGSNGANRIAGREGNDTITGGAGNDTFVFDSAFGADNVDTIVDFSSAADTFQLRSTVFSGLAAGTLAQGSLRGGATAQDADDRIIYDRTTGQLWFDKDGTGEADQILFAELENKTSVSLDDFFVF